MSEPLAFLLTWTTYGTWLPGDERYWVKKHRGFQPPNNARRSAAGSLMKEPECRLTDAQRRVVEATIAAHCRIRGWVLHAVNCRTNHVHVVVSAANIHPDTMVSQFKAWCTRRLKESLGENSVIRHRWWTERSSTRIINNETGLEAAILYVRDAQ